MTWRLILTLCVACSSLSSDARLYQGRYISVSGGQAPFWPTTFPNVEGIASLAIRGDGKESEVVVIAAQPPIVGQVAGEIVETWQFLPTAFPLFKTVVRYRLSDPARCGAVANPHIVIRLPMTIEVTTPRTAICDEKVDVVEAPIRRRVINGVALCECPTRVPMVGALVDVSEVNARVRSERAVMTDGRGTFRVDGLSDGIYDVFIRGAGGTPTRFRVQVEQHFSGEPVEFGIRPAAVVNDLAPVVVTKADLPAYPEDARRAGIAGRATIRVSFQANKVIDYNVQADSSVLGAAALANVRTWRFAAISEPVLEIEFAFRLETPECASIGGSEFDLDFPRRILVIARRPGPCRS